MFMGFGRNASLEKFSQINYRFDHFVSCDLGNPVSFTELLGRLDYQVSKMSSQTTERRSFLKKLGFRN